MCTLWLNGPLSTMLRQRIWIARAFVQIAEISIDSNRYRLRALLTVEGFREMSLISKRIKQDAVYLRRSKFLSDYEVSYCL